MICFVQIAICLLLIERNLISEEKVDFISPSPLFMCMQVLTAYLFHIETMSGAKYSYQRIKFLYKYPDRFDKKV